MTVKSFLHTMIRVTDIDKSVHFYSKILGMSIHKEYHNLAEGYSLVFLGYGTDSVIELTYNHGVDSYDIGNGFGHIAIGVDDCEKECERLKQSGVNISMPPKSMDGLNEVIAFVDDPDGYKIELIQPTTQIKSELVQISEA